MKAYVLLIPLLLILGCASELPPIEEQMLKQGLVDIHTLDHSILLDLKYSSTDNFLGKDAYGDLNRCYLRPEAARKLVEAQKLLQSRRPHLSLLVYDGARPRAVQRDMWALVEGTDQQPYVANPDRGSIHNYGLAVDLTLATLNGEELDMGTEFDYFGDLAQPQLEEQFLADSTLSQEQYENRLILREVMEEAGFLPITVEWWHFSAFSVQETKERFQIIE